MFKYLYCDTFNEIRNNAYNKSFQLLINRLNALDKLVNQGLPRFTSQYNIWRDYILMSDVTVLKGTIIS